MDNQIDYNLGPSERILKHFWIKHPERHLDQPCEENTVQDLLIIAFSQGNLVDYKNYQKKFNEPLFIPDDLDCAFVPHLRYMPPFWHEHEFFEALCVLSGSCDNIFRDRVFTLKAGDICIHAPGTVHSVRAFSDDDIVLNILIRQSTFDKYFFSLMEEDGILADFLRHSFFEATDIPYLIFHTNQDEDIRSLILAAVNEYKSSNKYRRQMLNAMLSGLFIRVFQRYEDDMEVSYEQSGYKNSDIIAILRYMQDNFKEIKMQDLASAYGYSTRQLQRIISKATGQSFHEIIQTQKLRFAEDMLLRTDYSVQTVAEESGFPSVNNFRKQFKKHFGVMPNEFRMRELQVLAEH